MIKKKYKICVVGLGYVGLPLMLELSNFFDVIGIDADRNRVNELKKSFDRNLEDIEIMQLAKNSLKMYLKRFGKESKKRCARFGSERALVQNGIYIVSYKSSSLNSGGRRNDPHHVIFNLRTKPPCERC